DAGAPAQLAYAVACSVAWHGRGPTLLLDLSHSASSSPAASDSHAPVEVRTGQLEGAYAPEHLPRVVRELGRTHDYVLVQLPPSVPVLPFGQAVRLGQDAGINVGTRYAIHGWVDGDGQ